MSFEKRDKAKKYTPKENDTLEKIAEKETQDGNKMSWQELACFNWGTDKQEVVNEFLRDELGCYKRDDQNNFIMSSDAEGKGEMLIPVRFKKDALALEKDWIIRVKRKLTPPRQFAGCSRVHGISFELDKSFIRPSVVDDIKRLEKVVKKNREAKIIIFGHADKTGQADEEKRRQYNKDLSERRAKSVYAFITDDADTWEELFNKENWGTKAIQAILKDFGGTYDPGPVDGIKGPKTETAIKNFQGDNALTVDGIAGPLTRKKMFTQYMTSKHDINIPPEQFMDPKHMGCGEFNLMKETPNAYEPSRRVTFFLFHKDRPLKSMPCKAGDMAPCKKQIDPPTPRHMEPFKCSFYDSIARDCPCEGKFPPLPTVSVYLQLLFLDPEKNARPFPKDMPVIIHYNDDTTEEIKTLDGGKLKFDAATSKETFTLEFKYEKLHYFVAEPPGQKESIEFVPEDTLEDKLKKKHRVFSLPLKWTSVEADWQADGYADYKDGRFEKIDTAGEAIGTDDKPVKLTLDPKWHYNRFVYFDRYYGHSHHKSKSICIPPILVKGSRKSTDGTSANPVDTSSNWTINTSDVFNACQCVPWILTKKTDGNKLADLDKDMMLEFSLEENTYIEATAADKREIKKLDPTKIKIDLDRPKKYDLPKLWKSKNYYARFTDGKGKFSYDLTADDIKIAVAPDKPLIFNLDDIVLVKTNGSQVIKDKDKDDADKDLSDDSRVSLLYLDTLDKKKPFQINIHKPNSKAQYHTNLKFNLNIIIDYHAETRAVVFCSNFYHIYDKRTAQTADFDFAKKHVLGARAAMIDDTRISHKANIRTTDYTDYCGGCGNFDIHYLHYAGIDIKTGADANKSRIVNALVSFWSCRLYKDTGNGGTDVHVKKYRELGMNNAMNRWNSKDYELYLTNREDYLTKTFALLEAKVNDDSGGPHLCKVNVTSDAKGSSIGNTSSSFRYSAHKEEPGRFDTVTDYDGKDYPCLAVAHELGHAQGLDDEYDYSLKVTDSWRGLPRYKQYYDGMPYVFDAASIMKRNQAPRLRHYWGKVTWINNNIANIPGLQNTDKEKIKVVFPGQKPKYTRPAGETVAAIYTTVGNIPNTRKETGYDWGANGATCDLFLYRLGDDEFARTITTNQIYTGILVANTRVHLSFSGASWDENKKYQWTQTLNNTMDQGLNRKYRLARKNGSGDYDNTFLRFYWQYTVTNPDPDGSHHFRFTINDTGNDIVIQHAHPERLTIGKNCDMNILVAYCIGIDTSRFEGFFGWIRRLLFNDIGKDDLARLEAWMQTKAGAEFKIHTL
ncbi:MAG: peptidoglycan-binding protein [Sedimentisphaerales bacterium]|nr:peptidoglycan-binding protein [Sedimentisphaerales bacterium]